MGVCLPLWDSIVHCQEAPPSSWPQAAYDIIGKSCDISSRSCDITGKSCVGHVTNGGLTLCAGRADVAKSVNVNTYTLPLKMEVHSYTITDSVTMDMLFITVM